MALAMHQTDMIIEPEEHLFFVGRPQELALYELFRCQLLAEVGQVQIKVLKTQITFAGRHGFAFVSHPRRKKDVGILVSLGCPTARILTGFRMSQNHTPIVGLTMY